MLILALDTTSRAGSAAVLEDDHILALHEGDATRTHGERLPAELQAVLDQAGVTLDRIDLLAVARGPGAFTGLRIGLACMQGLALVTGRPIIGISALEAMAAAAPPAGVTASTRVGVWMDASRGEVFSGLYDVVPDGRGHGRLTTLVDAEAADPAATWAGWAAWREVPVWLCGDGATRYAPGLTGLAGTWPTPLLAAAVGRLALDTWVRTAGRPEAVAFTPHHLQPLYVRRPDVERARD